ncbi:hypothetical protein MYP_2601 [Sporocytophaga myxococcoides]|uniref:Uncharacterized protein n=1 Tax=Sporocytophaga myxococcoides TaxID=153721 RepID=A0A098LG08_9BACT|nr:hypothetical protein MYP_2601 [Sporocytophaga myxococcoides]
MKRGEAFFLIVLKSLASIGMKAVRKKQHNKCKKRFINKLIKFAVRKFLCALKSGIYIEYYKVKFDFNMIFFVL